MPVEVFMLKADNVSFRYGAKEVLRGISAQFEPGKVTVIIGPNGSGKTTFLKTISGELKPEGGEISYGKIALNRSNFQLIARIRSVLAQQSELSFPLTVREVVMMGRYPHFSFKPAEKDEVICRQAIEKLNLNDFVERNYLTLSGGERQRVHFARVLAQIWENYEDNNRYLLLDEPISSLDLNYQHEFLKMAKELAKNDTVVVAVLHDVNLTAQYADFVYLLKEGTIVDSGEPRQVITPENLYTLYNIKCEVMQSDNRPFPYFIVE